VQRSGNDFPIGRKIPPPAAATATIIIGATNATKAAAATTTTTTTTIIIDATKKVKQRRISVQWHQQYMQHQPKAKSPLHFLFKIQTGKRV
jgi:hypothetical protein